MIPIQETRKGTYILWLTLPDDTRLTIGKRGTFDFPRGVYAYVGSAFGGGGLAGRLRHHLSPVKRPHWHIDYLRTAATVTHVWTIASTTVYEHQWASVLQHMDGASVPVPRFGASDCRCTAHLIHFDTPPQQSTFEHIANVSVNTHHIPING